MNLFQKVLCVQNKLATKKKHMHFFAYWDVRFASISITLLCVNLQLQAFFCGNDKNWSGRKSKLKILTIQVASMKSGIFQRNHLPVQLHNINTIVMSRHDSLWFPLSCRKFRLKLLELLSHVNAFNLLLYWQLYGRLKKKILITTKQIRNYCVPNQLLST